MKQTDGIYGPVFKCPFCGKDAQAGYTAEDEAVVIHALPMCAEFERLDPLEYVIQVNRNIASLN